MTRSDLERKLAAWVAEWELDRTLQEAYPQPSPAPGGEPRGSCLSIGPAGERLEEGDIVLLPPYGPFSAARPVYVALSKALGDDRWEVVPFSRFSVPATEGEWSTGRKAIPLKVLCPWNRGQLLGETLRSGWKAGRLTKEENKRLLQSLDGPPTGTLLALAGPPLVHPLDPRFDYLEEERALWFDKEGRGYDESPFVEEEGQRAADLKKDDYD